MEVGFSTLKGKGQDLGTNKHGNQAPYRNEPREKKRSCIRGKPHFLERCYYLIDSIRPRNWTPDPEIQKKADEILDSKPRIRAAVEAVQHKTKRTGSGMEKERKDGTPLMACVVSGTGVRKFYLFNNGPIFRLSFKGQLHFRFRCYYTC